MHDFGGGMGGYWIKLPGVSPSDADKKENNNLVLYIVIGAVAVVAVAAIAFFLLKKKFTRLMPYMKISMRRTPLLPNPSLSETNMES